MGGNASVASSLFRRLGEEDAMQMNAGKCRVSLAVEWFVSAEAQAFLKEGE